MAEKKTKKGGKKKDGNNKDAVYKKITDLMIQKMEEDGLPPWRKSWNRMNLPRNYNSGRRYRGLNLILLSFSSFPSPFFITYNKIKEMNEKVKDKIEKKTGIRPEEDQVYIKKITDADGNIVYDEKGRYTLEAPSTVVYWRPMKKTVTVQKLVGGVMQDVDEERRFFIGPFYHRVYNASQVHGLPEKRVKFVNPENQPVDAVEIIQQKLKIKVKSGDPAYRSIEDVVYCPDVREFLTPEQHALAKVHEFTHWTGHESRLNRESIKDPKFGSDPYCFEELIAELSAAMVSAELGFQTAYTIKDSAAYLKGWVSKLREEPKYLIEASTPAGRAAAYLTTYGESTRFEDEEGEVENDDATSD